MKISNGPLPIFVAKNSSHTKRRPPHLSLFLHHYLMAFQSFQGLAQSTVDKISVDFVHACYCWGPCYSKLCGFLIFYGFTHFWGSLLKLRLQCEEFSSSMYTTLYSKVSTLQTSSYVLLIICLWIITCFKRKHFFLKGRIHNYHRNIKWICTIV